MKNFLLPNYIQMKRITLLISALLAFALNVCSQEFVSTEVSNRNVLIEEFTGKACVNCPAGHITSNQLIEERPGRVNVVNVHAGAFSTTSYPNMNTDMGDSLVVAYGVALYPSAVINRSTNNFQQYNNWRNIAMQQLNLVSECNVAGQVAINPVTRMASITVEVYYTDNSDESSNYLTVYMLQDSILGEQSGSGTNPEQMVGEYYCHMHVLRDVVTPTWGDVLSPTTEGTLITKTYEYVIPSKISEPNGVEVDLENVHFLAFVTEKHQGNTTNPVLNVNPLNTFVGTDEEVMPYLIKSYPKSQVVCSTQRTISTVMSNRGTQDITSMKFQYVVDNENVTEYSWNGVLSPNENIVIDNVIEVPFGEHNVKIKVVETNGLPFDITKSIDVTTDVYADLSLDASEEMFTIEIMQDKNGKQLTWELISSDNGVIASDGPYNTLLSGNTKLHEYEVVLHDGECVKFTIKDSAGNGICCDNGDGYYRILDADGNIVLDGDGAFGSMATHSFHLVYDNSLEDTSDESKYNIYPNPADDVVFIEGVEIREVNLYSLSGQLLKSYSINEERVKLDISSLQNGLYIINIINKDGESVTRKISVID